ncbi:MAG: acetylxylan esterase [Pirellulales bacterium]
MKYLILLILSVCLSGLCLAQDKATIKRGIALKVITDREDAIYAVGEKVTFKISASDEAGPISGQAVQVVLSTDGYKPQVPQTLELKEGTAEVNGRLDLPGFLSVKVTVKNAIALAAAAVDPLKIMPSQSVPDDFDEFWDAQRKSLAAIPAKVAMNPIPSPLTEVQAFDVTVDCLGAPVSGYFGKPVGAQPKSLPAILFVHGAGVNSSNLGSLNWCKQAGGMLAMDINAHGLPNGKPKEFYSDLANGELKDYRVRGRQSRDEIYFRGMFLRLIRAIDFLTSQPEWDGKRLIVYGSSQGGFQALAAAGLDSRVTFICAGVPAGCDHTGSQAGRISGWPKIVATDSAGQPDPQSLQASRYFDAVNFARRAKCVGAALTVGFIDTTCPPTSVYAAYNALNMTKSIHNDPLSGHTSTPAASKFMQAAALEHLK